MGETTATHCHCGAEFRGSDHCPECLCEQYEGTCDHTIGRGSRDHTPCSGCGQLTGFPEYDAELWSMYDRLPSGRQHIEPLVYTSADIEEAGGFCDDGSDGIMLSMERNMAERGLCIECGRPNLSGIDPSTLLSEKDARDLAEMHAEMEAERRAGC